MSKNTIAAAPVDEDNGYFDEVGGYHCDAIGYAPNGQYCGECCRSTCAACSYYKGGAL